MPAPQDVNPFVMVALAGMSNMTGATVTNPIDVIKTRLQIQGELQQKAPSGSAPPALKYKGMIRGGMTIVGEEGVRGLYKGLPPSLLREASYSAIRMGLYEQFKVLFGATDPAHTPLYKKLAAGACTGALGSAIANPTDLIKVRMQAQADGARYPGGTLAAFKQVFRAEGLRGLYRGVGPTTQRAAMLTATQVPSYDHTKHTLLNAGLFEEGLALHAVSSMVAGVTTALVTSPIDLVKTRMMNQPLDEAGRGLSYKSSLDCALKTLRAEGPRGLYKGFTPQWMRIGPHTIVTFMVFEKLRSIVHVNPI